MSILIDTVNFADKLTEKFDFFAGVPDSLLADLCAALEKRLPKKSFLTAANEGNAVALCAGYTLATGKPGVVYMQNSGLGNALNPLLSLNDSLVYKIPCLLVVGWRGEPDGSDEPQHKKQGLVTRELLDICDIPWKVLESEDDIEWSANKISQTGAPTALLVRKGVFERFNRDTSFSISDMPRETAIEAVLDALEMHDYRIISTTGMISRELYALREKRGEPHTRDFLTVGSMGHASSIALGMALQCPKIKIVVIDGDGAALMHLGALATIGASDVDNLIHIVLNNAAHDSVGGQATVGGKINLVGIAKSCGYKSSISVANLNDLAKALKANIPFIEVEVALRENHDLIRPPSDLIRQKLEFLR